MKAFLEAILSSCATSQSEHEQGVPQQRSQPARQSVDSILQQGPRLSYAPTDQHTLWTRYFGDTISHTFENPMEITFSANGSQATYSVTRIERPHIWVAREGSEHPHRENFFQLHRHHVEFGIQAIGR